jgi:hypothetical protein
MKKQPGSQNPANPQLTPVGSIARSTLSANLDSSAAVRKVKRIESLNTDHARNSVEPIAVPWSYNGR